MIRLLKEKNYNIMQFQPFLDYIDFLESQGYTQNTELEEYDWIEEKYNNEDVELKILSYKNQEKEWVTILKTKNNVKIEQIEFMAYNEYYCQKLNQDYNRVIKYAAHFEDEEFTRMVCSTFRYRDNNYLDGWRELRKFEVADLDKVMYSKQMNLMELILWVYKNIAEFYEVISLKEVKELKLNY